MHVTFIRPNLFAGRSHDAMQPLVFAALRAMTPDDVDTSLQDERLGPIDFDRPTDLAAVTVETFTARRSYQIAAAFRRRGVKVVFGGFHPSLLADEASRHADALVMGDAEGVWPQVVSDAKAGRLQQVYRAAGFAPITASRFDRSIFRDMKYLPLKLVQYGRGCRFNCDFCSIRAFYGSSVRQRGLDALVQDIAAPPRRHIFFVDDNLFIDPVNARNLFDAIAPLGVSWSCQASIDVTRDVRLVERMQRSGCASVLIGFESLNPASLRQMGKGWNQRHGAYDESIRILRDQGIMIYGTFVIGYDHDTADVFERTLDFALAQKLYLANFNPLTPTPGTPLYRRLAAEGRLLYDRWWLDERYRYGDATFRPARMSATALSEGCYDVRRRFNSCTSIIKRMADRKANVRTVRQAAVYLASNVVNRREILSKQWRHLGEPGAIPVMEATACA